MDWLELILFIALGITALVVSSMALAAFVSRKEGNFWLWFILLCFLPVISHILLIIFLWVYLPRKRKAFRKISGHHKATDALITNIEKGPESTPSVTPFDDKEDLTD